MLERDKTARLQSDFYRDSYHKMLNALTLSSLIILALIIAIIYFVLFSAPPQYYAMTTTGQIISMVPGSG